MVIRLSTYVVSDIHGMYDKFTQMLQLINFTKEDELYILSDIFDRGEQPIDILEHIIAHDNIHLIRGNHEEMFLDYYNYGKFDICCNWIINGGYTTFNQIQDYQMKSNINYLSAVAQYINKLPLYKIVEVNNVKYFLVHAEVDTKVNEELNYQTKDKLLWESEDIHMDKQFKDYVVIHGHTPVQLIEQNNNGSIIKRKHNIYIDCGAYFNGGKLGCLRLDDLKEFYV